MYSTQRSTQRCTRRSTWLKTCSMKYPTKYSSVCLRKDLKNVPNKKGSGRGRGMNAGVSGGGILSVPPLPETKMSDPLCQQHTFPVLDSSLMNTVLLCGHGFSSSTPTVTIHSPPLHKSSPPKTVHKSRQTRTPVGVQIGRRIDRKIGR